MSLHHFGNQTVQGIILELTDSSPIQDPKSIIDLLDPAPVLTPPQIALAIRLADTTLNPLAAIVNLMIPTGLSQQADVLYQTVNGRPQTVDHGPQSTVNGRLLKLLTERGPLRGRQIDSHFAKVDWRKTANMLVKKGVLSAKNVLPAPRVRPKYIRVAQLSVKPEAAEAEMESLGSTKQTLARRQAALRFLIRQPDAVNLSWIYAETGCNIADLQELEERGLIRLFENEIFRDPLGKIEKQTASEDLTLTPEQTEALQKITSAFSLLPSAFLLYGVTGSGKTEIYLRAAEEVIQKGKQVIVLVPEIALTPQLVRRFLSRFPGQVGLVHSKLSEGERYDTWRRARDGKLNVIIGARSALFSPLPNIGLIVVDECHDSSYYQAEPPYYNAMTAAQDYARLCGAVCVMGSATPTIEQRFQAESGGVQILGLPNRVTDSALPPVQVVDMREELKNGNRGIFSRSLTESLAETISRGEQAIIFLNRRGTATYIFCRDCGHVLKCPNCETPLTLHVDGIGKSKVESQATFDLRPLTYFAIIADTAAKNRRPAQIAIASRSANTGWAAKKWKRISKPCSRRRVRCAGTGIRPVRRTRTRSSSPTLPITKPMCWWARKCSPRDSTCQWSRWLALSSRMWASICQTRLPVRGSFKHSHRLQAARGAPLAEAKSFCRPSCPSITPFNLRHSMM
ncbi:MAG: primosomal protein N' [Anaerolineales bacterium]|nr:primosomal protein N' [Anaerolineales bacterium]